MKNPTSRLRCTPFAMALALLLTACGSGGGPEAHHFDLHIQTGSLVGESVLQVKQNDTVTMVVSTDEPISFHLHGYNIGKDSQPGAPATLAFTADVTGSFPFTMHAEAQEEAQDHDHDDHSHGGEGEEEEEVTLGRLEVQP